MKKTMLALALSGVLFGCQSTSVVEQSELTIAKSELSIPIEKFKLDNGLTVILHQDTSDPVVAVATIVHVGSNREKTGRTGFAHFFEHMAFSSSENVPAERNGTLIEELGGMRNGGTGNDTTMYYEVVPKDALEKVLWNDSDRLGFMINTVTEGALEREKQVVKNEKRERVDNVPYGHTESVIRKNLYPKGHPYNWTVIGELEDLQAASLSEVKEFHSRFYGPANATLVIAGDINIQQTKNLVKRWFGEIKKSQPIEKPKAQPVVLKNTKKLYHLDQFAKLPELRITFPTVKQYHKDSYALAVLGEILSNGKSAPLYKTVVNEKHLAPAVYAYETPAEIAGTFTIHIRANANQDLNDVNLAINQALTDFENNGFSDDDLQRIKARQETRFYNGMSSVLDKAFRLGIYQEYAGDPQFAIEEIKNIQSVSRHDVIAVYQKYIKDKNYIMTSFVPKDQPNLMVAGSENANVQEEKIVQGVEKNFDSKQAITFEKTVTKYDRSEPKLSGQALVTMPKIHQSQQANGLNVLNVEHTELPLVNFSLRVDGGAWLETKDNYGAAKLLAELLNEGTATKTPEELENEIGLLGASIHFSADLSGIQVKGNTLARNFDKTIELVSEMLLHPRFDENEFNLIKLAQLNKLQQKLSNPSSIASNGFFAQYFGEEHRAGSPVDGTSETISALTIEDLKDFFKTNLSPKNATLHVVGDIAQSQILSAIKPLVKNWQGEKIELPVYPSPQTIKKPRVYFIDIPNAKQSAILVGKPTMKGSDADYYKMNVVQNKLGGGESGRLFQKLRVEKGYTYGAYAFHYKTIYKSPLLAFANVRSNVTLESLMEFKNILSDYDKTYTAEDLAITKNTLIKQNTRNYETLDNLLGVLENISSYDLPLNYVEQEQAQLNEMTLAQVKAIYHQYANEQEMLYVVAGDAKTQLAKIKGLGYGEPILLDRNGHQI